MPKESAFAGTTVRIGTRGSKLARWQTDFVAESLRVAHPHINVEIIVMSTKGDRVLDKPLPAIGGKGLFTEELEAALLSKEIDVAVHSLKDLPVVCNPGLIIGAVSARADARDALVSRGETLSSLKQRAVVGTSSLRRIAQLKRLRPDLEIRDVRGNVDTRVKKVLELREYDAILLACAGLDRLGMDSVITQRMTLDDLMPAPGQAALGIQCRDDLSSRALLAPLNHAETELCVTAERAFLQGLGGGCAVPVAAYATFAATTLHLRGRVTSVDSTQQVDVELQGPTPDTETAKHLGQTLAQQAIAQGAGALLKHT